MTKDGVCKDWGISSRKSLKSSGKPLEERIKVVVRLDGVGGGESVEDCFTCLLTPWVCAMSGGEPLLEWAAEAVFRQWEVPWPGLYCQCPVLIRIVGWWDLTKFNGLKIFCVKLSSVPSGRPSTSGVLFIALLGCLLHDYFRLPSSYEGCSKSNTYCFIILVHDIKGRCWWYNSRGWTFSAVLWFCCQAPCQFEDCGAIASRGCTVPPHPLCSLDLASSDFHLLWVSSACAGFYEQQHAGCCSLLTKMHS